MQNPLIVILSRAKDPEVRANPAGFFAQLRMTGSESDGLSARLSSQGILQTRPGKGRSEIPQFQNTYAGMLAGGSAREISSQGAGFACAADPRIYGVDTMRNAILHPKSRHASVPKSIGVPMGKVFKSGNSAALRLPAGLKVPVGKTFALTPTASGFVATDPVELAKRRKGLSALFGSAPDFPSRES
ncbi:hypothetical protein [Opitutus sp. GAS368]|uniref:hypothetical protein n=1 Tax=Opitutus sp. GAS368 TaxID=1882749 RepID=UPI001E3586C9|nr:hypothetical protein [Opitutus sp. GAS368]